MLARCIRPCEMRIWMEKGSAAPRTRVGACRCAYTYFANFCNWDASTSEKRYLAHALTARSSSSARHRFPGAISRAYFSPRSSAVRGRPLCERLLRIVPLLQRAEDDLAPSVPDVCDRAKTVRARKTHRYVHSGMEHSRVIVLAISSAHCLAVR